MLSSPNWVVSGALYADTRDEMWDHRPRPREDESFTSWFVRTAKANCADAPRLFEILLELKPGSAKKIEVLEVDRALKGELAAELEPHVGLGCAELEGVGLPDPTGDIKRLGWTFLTRPTVSPRYCPLCLETDAEPYFRSSWHLPFVTVCPRHEILLRDRCPHCSAPIHYWESPWNRPIVTCSQCLKPLTTGISFLPRARDPAALRIQDHLVEVYERGTLQGEPVDAASFFRQLADLVRRESEDPGVADLIGLSADLSAERVFRALALVFDRVCRGTVRDSPPVKEGGRRVVREVKRHLRGLNLPRGYATHILTDVAAFLAQAPPKFTQRVARAENPHDAALGLTWILGKYYGLTRRKLGAQYGTNRDAVRNSARKLKNWAQKTHTVLPESPPFTWVECILGEVHEKTHLLSRAELAELAREFWNLDIPWKSTTSWEQISFFAEYLYLYWAKNVGRTVRPLPKLSRTGIPTVKIRHQLAKRLTDTKVERHLARMRAFLRQIVRARGVDPADCAPLTAFEAFRAYLKAKFPRWRTFTLHKLAATLFPFVKERSPAWSLSHFSRVIGFLPSTVYANLQRL